MIKCVFCKKLLLSDETNNAEPLSKGSCYNNWNSEIVIPARVKELIWHKK